MIFFKTFLNTRVIAQRCSAKKKKKKKPEKFRNITEQDTHDNKRIQEFSKL